jgi:hypothetical protein
MHLNDLTKKDHANLSKPEIAREFLIPRIGAFLDNLKFAKALPFEGIFRKILKFHTKRKF